MGVRFSSYYCTLVVREPVSASVIIAEDVHRLVIAATHVLKENFRLNQKDMKAVQCYRPSLIRCVRDTLAKVKRRTKGNLRHILAVVSFATMVLAEQEKIIPKKSNLKKLNTSTNLYRYILMREMKAIVMLGEGEGLDKWEDEGKDKDTTTKLPCHC